MVEGCAEGRGPEGGVLGCVSVAGGVGFGWGRGGEGRGGEDWKLRIAARIVARIAADIEDGVEDCEFAWWRCLF